MVIRKKGANQMPTARGSGIAHTSQSGVERLRASRKNDRTEPYIAQVVKVYSERNTCDVQSLRSGQLVRDVPLTTKAGLIDGEVYGTLDMPAVNDIVIVSFIENRESLPVILGTVLPFLSSEYSEDTQTLVNSSNKAHTLKLLETGKENAYRKVFKSGTTFEVDDDGTITIETPSGTYVQINEDTDEIGLTDQHGNTFTIDSNGIVVVDANSNTFTLDSSGVIIEDVNGNDITMTTGKVTINSNLEVIQ